MEVARTAALSSLDWREFLPVYGFSAPQSLASQLRPVVADVTLPAGLDGRPFFTGFRQPEVAFLVEAWISR